MQSIQNSNKIADIITKALNSENILEDIKNFGDSEYFFKNTFEYIERNYPSSHSQRYYILKSILIYGNH